MRLSVGKPRSVPIVLMHYIVDVWMSPHKLLHYIVDEAVTAVNIRI